MLDLPDDPLAFFDRIEALGLTDGLPVIPPLPAYVDAMVAAAGLPADEPVASVPPEGSVATVGKLAVSAVMAGCRPEYFPVVVAAIRALATPRYNLLAVQTTTNPVTPVLVVNGPVRMRIGLACGRGCLGNGFRANATIGRAIRRRSPCWVGVVGMVVGCTGRLLGSVPESVSSTRLRAGHTNPMRGDQG